MRRRREVVVVQGEAVERNWRKEGGRGEEERRREGVSKGLFSRFPWFEGLSLHAASDGVLPGGLMKLRTVGGPSLEP